MTERTEPRVGDPNVPSPLNIGPAPAAPGAAAPGAVLDAAPTIACGDGTALRLTRLQRPGRAPLPAAAFLRGYALPPGTVLAPCPSTP